MRKIMWGLTIIAGCISGIVLFVGLTFSTGAPQQAATAGIAIALPAIPYMIARAITELKIIRQSDPPK